MWKNDKTRKLFGLFYSHKMHLLALLGLFTDQDDKISHPFINVTQWNPYPFLVYTKTVDSVFRALWLAT